MVTPMPWWTEKMSPLTHCFIRKPLLVLSYFHWFFTSCASACMHLNLSWLHRDNPNYTQNCRWAFTRTFCWKVYFLISTRNNFHGTAYNYPCHFHGHVIWVVQSPHDVSPPVLCSVISTEELQSTVEIMVFLCACMVFHFACMNFSVFLLFIFSKMITHFFPCDALILHYFNNVLYYHCSHQLHANYQDHWIFCVNNQLHHFQTSPPLLSTPISFIIPISNWHFFPVTHLAFCQLILTLFSFAYTFLHITSPKLRKMKFKSTLPSTNKFLIKYPVNLLQTAFGKIQAIFISFLVISLD